MSEDKTNLFNNPMVEAAMKSLTPEQREEYEKIGKYMYETTDYTQLNPTPKSVEEDMVNGVFYVRESLKSGLHPQDMDKKEIQLMYEIYGPKWYEEYGYTEDDIPKVTIPKDIKSQQNHPDIPMTEKQLRKLEKKTNRKMWKKLHPNKSHKKKIN